MDACLLACCCCGLTDGWRWRDRERGKGKGRLRARRVTHRPPFGGRRLGGTIDIHLALAPLSHGRVDAFELACLLTFAWMARGKSLACLQGGREARKDPDDRQRPNDRAEASSP